ncbi:creatininase family protein [Candidatus Latescibacterota bacterium]
MRWEELTYKDFPQAVEACGSVAILPVGVIEPHGAHLPLGTDTMAAHWVACQAAEREPAIVFPPYPWGINHEGAHLPGAIVLKRDLLFSLLEAVCDEMGRNGIRKVLITSGHGGNRYLLPLFVQTLVEKQTDYVAYYCEIPSTPEANKVLETKEGGHACEGETSRMLHLRPDLVKMEQIPEPFTSRNRNEALRDVGVYSPVDWYSMYPNMYVGDATKATAAKGEALSGARVDALVKAIAAVKADTITPELLAEFGRGSAQPSSPY